MAVEIGALKLLALLIEQLELRNLTEHGKRLSAPASAKNNG